MTRVKVTARRRLLVVGAGFVCGGAFIALLAFVIGLTPVGEEVMWAGVIGGTVPLVIGLVLVLIGVLLRR